jgi:hypothetical protein
MTGAFLVDWVGRRPLFITSTAGMFIGKYTMLSIIWSSKLTKHCAAFCMWTLTTALFNSLHNTAAAKGTSDLTFAVGPHWFGILSATVPLILWVPELCLAQLVLQPHQRLLLVLWYLFYSLNRVLYLWGRSFVSCIRQTTDSRTAVEILPYGIRARGFALMVSFCSSIRQFAKQTT